MIATYDYLIDGNMEFQKVFRWYKRRKVKYLKLGTDVIYEAIKEIKYIGKDEYINKSNPRISLFNKLIYIYLKLNNT